MRATYSDISVIIPCHNGARYLDGAITSALEQSHAPSSVIVVDDASTDGSREIAQSYAARGYPVRCIALERNGGPAAARNVALAHVTEPFVAFLDADDRWTPQHCESLLALLLRYPEADLAFARTQSTDPSLPQQSVLPVPAGEPVDVLEHLLNDNFIPQSAVLARRSRILAAGGYTESMRFSEDYDLWLRMAHGRRFVASAAVSCIRTCHTGQATNDAVRMYRGAWEARARYLEYATRVGAVVSNERFSAICAAAYERDLASAWQSRSLRRLCGVLDLGRVVSIGHPIRRRWTLRTITFWPAWRLAAACWDALPETRRSSFRAARSRWSTARATPSRAIAPGARITADGSVLAENTVSTAAGALAVAPRFAPTPLRLLSRAPGFRQPPLGAAESWPPVQLRGLLDDGAPSDTALPDEDIPALAAVVSGAPDGETSQA